MKAALKDDQTVEASMARASAALLIKGTQKPNAEGKGRPHGCAEASNDVGVPLTEKLGCGEKEQPLKTSKP